MLEKKESKLKELQARISKSAFQQWLSSNSTKALLMQIEIDREELTEHWAAGRYNDVENQRAIGQSDYMLGLPFVIKELGGSFGED